MHEERHQVAINQKPAQCIGAFTLHEHLHLHLHQDTYTRLEVGIGTSVGFENRVAKGLAEAVPFMLTLAVNLALRDLSLLQVNQSMG